MLIQLFQRLAALISLAVLAGAAYLLWSWWDLRQAVEAGYAVQEEPWRLWTGLGLAVLSFLGKWPVIFLFARGSHDRARMKRAPGQMVETPNGARLYVETHGPQEAPALIFVHGWGLDAGTWWDARRLLASRYRIIAYDLAGLGRSEPPADGHYSLERFAEDLMAVLQASGARQAILVGHSIGGMTLQTFARTYPQALGVQVKGLVLENTTHTDPTATTILGGALQATKPVLRLLMRADILLSPLVKLMNWQSYLSGSTHLAMRLGGFGSRPTRAQLDQVSLAATRNSPAVQAKGNLAMMRWDATSDLPRLGVPTLVFIGGRDIVTVPAAGETIAAQAPGAQASRQAEAGHLGPLELAEAYNDVLAKFADELFTRGAAWADRPPVTADASGTGIEPDGRSPRDPPEPRDRLA